jgi:hypothetical protein
MFKEQVFSIIFKLFQSIEKQSDPANCLHEHSVASKPDCDQDGKQKTTAQSHKGMAKPISQIKPHRIHLHPQITNHGEIAFTQ